MSHETPSGPRKSASARGRVETGGGEQSPLQCKARFLENWSWQAIANLNRGLCEGKRALFGPNPESHTTSQEEWQRLQKEDLTFLEVIRHLREFHRRAPFLFFNGNTFAELGRGLSYTLFAELAVARKKQIASLVAHFIAGVLGEAAMLNGLNDLVALERLQVGDRVATRRKSVTGTVIKITEDGKVIWKCDRTGAVMTGTPQSLIRLHP
jgi:hypothetical protein